MGRIGNYNKGRNDVHQSSPPPPHRAGSRAAGDIHSAYPLVGPRSYKTLCIVGSPLLSDRLRYTYRALIAATKVTFLSRGACHLRRPRHRHTLHCRPTPQSSPLSVAFMQYLKSTPTLSLNIHTRRTAAERMSCRRKIWRPAGLRSTPNPDDSSHPQL